MTITKKIEIELGDFAWTRAREEAERQGVTVEELVLHALLYFIADADSGRIARRVPREGRGGSETRGSSA